MIEQKHRLWLRIMRIVASCLIVAAGLAVVAATSSAFAQAAPAAKEDPLVTCQARVQADDRLVSDVEQKLNACTAKLNENPQNAATLKDLEGRLAGLFDRIDGTLQRMSAKQP